MTSITIFKDEEGKLRGWKERDAKAYAKFKAAVRDLAIGEMMGFRVWFPRNPKLHRLHFAVVGSLFDAQEQFDDPDDLRKWLYVGAGYCNVLPGPKGKMVAIPKSISYDQIDDAEFGELHESVVKFMQSEHALRFLWPHLDPQQAAETVEAVIGPSGE